MCVAVLQGYVYEYIDVQESQPDTRDEFSLVEAGKKKWAYAV